MQIIYTSLSPLSAAKILSRFLYLWLFPLMSKGWKVELTIDDCGTLPDELGAKFTRELLDAAILRHSDPKKLNLILTSLRAFTLAFVPPVFHRLLLLAGTISQPLLVSNISDAPPIDANGGALVGAFACMYGLIALMMSIYWEKCSFILSPNYYLGGNLDVVHSTSHHGYTLLHRGVGAAQKLWLGSADKRVMYLTSVLHNYLPMKWAHYEDVTPCHAKLLRSNEMQGARSF
ncbi:hypothetical protein B0H14DRAFT_2586905 [Mycena olivaceomarginata]|nr:hypothetical protein B0H14DRAFT_2586905 [Mycena olivaceomarginata]